MSKNVRCQLVIQPMLVDVRPCSHWSESHKSQCGRSSLNNTEQDLDDEMASKNFVFPMDDI